MAWKAFYIVPFFYFALGCSSPAVKLVNEAEHIQLQPIPSSDVSIYRSQVPAWPFIQIGAINVNGMNDLDGIYALIREESAKQGAHAVIEFDLDAEEVAVNSSSTICTPEGICTTTTVATSTMVYTAKGTLVAKQ